MRSFYLLLACSAIDLPTIVQETFDALFASKLRRQMNRRKAFVEKTKLEAC